MSPRPRGSRSLHGWNLTPQQARAVQQELCSRVVTEDRLGALSTVAGVDLGFPGRGRVAVAAVAVVSFPDLVPLREVAIRRPVGFPYVPGLLSFREIPAVLEALDVLPEPPDLLVCDGQGYAHPRRFGLACHLGVLTDIPALGIAKSRLIGEHQAVPEERGAWRPLVDRGEVVGAVLRTRTGIKPVYVSVGHRLSLATAIDLTLRLSPRYRLAEPIRRAHRLASGSPAARSRGGSRRSGGS